MLASAGQMGTEDLQHLVGDLLGGVEIDVKQEEVKYLNKYLGETARSAGKEAHPVEQSGVQLLDGTQATTYARIRSTAGGDFTRTERQRLVIEKMFEKALEADLGTINSIIDEVFPQVSTSFTLQEVLMYASAYSQYTLGENTGFPIDKTTDTISGLGSIVIPQDLASNVTKLHEFLFGTAGYTPSSTVQTVNANIISRVNSGGTSSSSETYDTGYYDGGYDYSYDYSDDYDSGYSDSDYYPDDTWDGSYEDDGADTGAGSGTDSGGADSAPDAGNPDSGGSAGSTDPGAGSGSGSGTGGSGGGSATGDPGGAGAGDTV